jgi:hypothetical protein
VVGFLSGLIDKYIQSSVISQIISLTLIELGAIPITTEYIHFPNTLYVIISFILTFWLLARSMDLTGNPFIIANQLVEVEAVVIVVRV